MGRVVKKHLTHQESVHEKQIRVAQKARRAGVIKGTTG